MGPFSFAALLILAAQDAGPADAGPDAGPDAGAEADAGPDACDPVCAGDTLQFCDDGAPATLDCTALGGRCGLLSADWGNDCVLGAGVACDPGYAFGASRCDRGAGLFCLDGACTAGNGPEDEPTEEPTPGTEIPLTTGSTNPFGCPDCGSGQSALLVPALFALRGISRRRRSPAHRAER
jgi:hypothetical protein